MRLDPSRLNLTLGTPSVSGDDLVGIFCPDKGLWVCVGIGDEADSPHIFPVGVSIR